MQVQTWEAFLSRGLAERSHTAAHNKGLWAEAGKVIRASMQWPRSSSHEETAALPVSPPLPLFLMVQSLQMQFNGSLHIFSEVSIGYWVIYVPGSLGHDSIKRVFKILMKGFKIPPGFLFIIGSII